jgi:hypothetical protein
VTLDTDDTPIIDPHRPPGENSVLNRSAGPRKVEN